MEKRRSIIMSRKAVGFCFGYPLGDWPLVSKDCQRFTKGLKTCNFLLDPNLGQFTSNLIWTDIHFQIRYEPGFPLTFELTVSPSKVSVKSSIKDELFFRKIVLQKTARKLSIMLFPPLI